jgi:hypothetical protein
VNYKTPIEISFAFERAMKLAGGEQEYGDSTKSAIWAEVSTNQEIRSLSLRYLVGDSHRAKLNLERLDSKLIETFQLGVVA